MNTFAQTDRFSKKRFSAVLKNEILSTRRTALIALGIAYSFFIIGLLFNALSFEGKFFIEKTAEEQSELFPLTMFMSTTIMASLVMHDASRKENRINIIMLPARNTEKYLSRIITVILYGVIVSFAIHIALHYLLLGARFLFENRRMYMGSIPLFGTINRIITVNHMDGTTTHSIISILDLTLLFVWIFTGYILGGFLWKGRSWIITSIMFVLLAITAGFVMTNIIEHIAPGKEYEQMTHYVLWIWCTSLSALNMYLSYIILKRMQVVEPKLLSIKRLWPRR